MGAKALIVISGAMALAGCGGSSHDPEPLACGEVGAAVAKALPPGVDSMRVLTSELVASSGSTPQHCHIIGAMNERTGAVDGKPYAVKFRLRMPTPWNGRYFMQGGGGSNGTLPDANGALGGQQTANALQRGYAVVATDSGHDNAVNDIPASGGVSSYGMDPIARIDFGYRAYDLTARIGKDFVTKYYAQAPSKSYFVGCSEGGREAALMSQRFPENFDGIVAGAPAISLPYHASYAPYLLKTFAPLAQAAGQVDANGVPLINKTFTDADVQLISDAVLQACDALDGLADGIAHNDAACTDAVVQPKLAAVTCTGAKAPGCLSAEQVSAFSKAIAGPKTSTGQQLYVGNSWDPGIGGMNGATFNGGFRSWWLGSYASDVNNAIKVTLSVPQHALVWRTPPQPVSADQYIDYELNFDIDDTERLISATTPLYTESAKSYGLANSADLGAFARRGGKLIVYHGTADSSHNSNDSARWFDAIDAKEGGTAARFVRLFKVPQMNHCSGGPATDRFDAFTPLVEWVEHGVAPDAIPASASAPGYFGVAARSRPLCPYPQWAKYKGSGDVNDAASFVCAAN
ncbi:MAG: tannase/feruloyl esterase family alpha/beta hydrolase [Burkholderiaceae bacterium]